MMINDVRSYKKENNLYTKIIMSPRQSERAGESDREKCHVAV